MVALFYSVLFSAIIVYLFLGSFKLSAIILLIIPVPLSAAISALLIWGLSLNTLTMLCMVLLIGIAIDDIVIIVENYIAGFEKKHSDNLKTYVVDIAQRVTPSIYVYALCMSIIFLSIVFTKGLANILFTSISVALVTGVIVSAVMSVVLASIACSIFVQGPPVKNHICCIFEQGLGLVKKAYLTSLKVAMNAPSLVLIFSILCFLPIFYVAPYINQNLFPPGSAKSQIIVQVKSDNLMNNAEFIKRLQQTTKMIRKNHNVKSTITSFNNLTNKAKVRVALVDFNNRNSQYHKNTT